MKSGAGVLFALMLLALAGTIPARAGDSGDDAGTALAGDSKSHRGDHIAVNVTRTADGYVVEGRCTTAVSRSEAWNVLTDYDAIDRFVSSMRESRITERAGDHLLVEQTAVGRLFLFSRRMTVVLFVHEEPPGSIVFEDVLRKDFVVYRGEWRIAECGAFREIYYRVTARPAFHVPDLIARGMFGRTVRDLLRQVEAEMVRRAALATVSRVTVLPGKDPV